MISIVEQITLKAGLNVLNSIYDDIKNKASLNEYE